METIPSLVGKNVLITGAARRVGKALALGMAQAGATLLVHHGHSAEEAQATCREIEALGGKAHILQADLADPAQAARLIEQALAWGPLYALVNNAAIFRALSLPETTMAEWQRHLAINLTAPLVLCQGFAAARSSAAPDSGEIGRIVNILDWRALRPGADHLPYTVSKAALATLTRSLAQALAPQITVNGIALGAVLPPSEGQAAPDLLAAIPAGRWARLEEVCQALLFLLTGPAYITGEILHVDGGRHLL